MDEIQTFLEPEIDKINLMDSDIHQIEIDNILQKLEPIIEVLLNKDFERLLNFLYRLDVSETVVNHILFDNHGEKTSMLLSEAIIRRELLRRYCRVKYSK